MKPQTIEANPMVGRAVPCAPRRAEDCPPCQDATAQLIERPCRAFFSIWFSDFFRRSAFGIRIFPLLALAAAAVSPLASASETSGQWYSVASGQSLHYTVTEPARPSAAPGSEMLSDAAMSQNVKTRVCSLTNLRAAIKICRTTDRSARKSLKGARR